MASSDTYHCDKQTLLTEHDLLIARTQVNSNASVIGNCLFELHTRKLFELNAFQSMKICDLAPGNIYQNKLIYSTQISDTAVADSIYFIIEDEYGNACRVSVPRSLASVPLVKGAKLAFLNPIFNIAVDGRYSLTVQNPPDISIIQFEPVIITLEKYPNPISVKDSSTQTDLIQPYDNGTNFSQIGNKLFKEGRYLQAIIQYTRAIEVNANDAVFYSNRALSYSKMGEYDNSLTDFLQANIMDPECFKYQYLVALIWSRIGNHKLSIDLLSKIKPKGNFDSLQVEKLLKELKLFVNNSQGEFDFAKIKKNFVNHIPNDIGDFIGPIQILSSPKHGRGIFTTRNVKKGENLCIVKATEFFDANLGSCICENCRRKMLTFITIEKSLHGEIVKSATKSKLTTVRIASLLDSTSNPIVNINLYSGCSYEYVKNFDTSQYPLDELFSMVTKKLVVDSYRFYPETPFALIPSGAIQFAYIFNGIWLLPSFINHSCIPNAVKIYIGDICIVRAITDIAAGEEVLVSYIPLALFPNVQERRRFMGFQCNCELCEFETENYVKEIVLE